MPLRALRDFSRQEHRRTGVRLGVLVWHFIWTGVMLCAFAGLLFLPVSLFGLIALLVAGIPGVSSVLLLSKNNRWIRPVLVWIWGGCALVAVGLTGGIAGPLAAWVVMPLAAAVALNQRRLISLGAALSFTIGLIAIALSLSHIMPLPSLIERLWLSSVAFLTLIGSFGLALMPALRARVERTHDAEEARARLFRLLSEQPQLIVSLTDEGRVISAFGEAPRGLDLNRLLTQGLYPSAHAPDRLALMQAVGQAMTTGRGEAGFHPHAALEAYVRLSVRKASDGRLYAVLADASGQKQREAALEAARFEAESLNRGKTQFVASMSHELRTPLNAVIGFSDIMRQKLFGPLSDKYTEYAQLIWESGQHVLDLVNDVLDMSKIEAQKYELSLERFDVRDPVASALRLIMATAQEKGVALKAVLPPVPLEVTADKRAVKQICLNLLSNAVKFTPNGGEIGLILTEAGRDGIEIQVNDTGVGIAPEDLDRLGKPYQQTGPLEQRVMGTGLGLSLVQALAVLHKGHMTIESEPGTGTSVSVILPVATPSDQPELPLEDSLRTIAIQDYRSDNPFINR
ncbi:sensor histidine kinase [Asticcacaulis tiandongensis]|uniref:sensor histidine kinase n=1 Tax=Asticcacaulis tiandongensis TaxID=2565365 RepID=UPI001FE2DD17|nr:HAMP domain-containing sensor histidine kinase [Asticcacaulis tiandongensis]